MSPAAAYTENWQAHKHRRETGSGLFYKTGPGLPRVEEGPSEMSVVIHSSPELKMALWEFTGRAGGSRKKQTQDKSGVGVGREMQNWQASGTYREQAFHPV